MLIIDKNNINSIDNWQELASLHGFSILINKVPTWTSFDVVAKLRNVLQIKKIGHCGTLDPFANGLLILSCGKATKTISYFQDLPKQYKATLKLGATTKTLDPESEEENITDISHIKNIDIENAVKCFIGEIQQVPPMFSAKKIKGQRLYELARKNIEIELKPVPVRIHNIEILDIKFPFVELLIDCSKGTYIRSLARDIGNKLQVGGYLTSLSRTAIGEYKLESALTIDDITKKI
ncbi:MAG: tRNA pseudouridine(55) synthase TruB [Ignavibacteria bacterium]|jgi:tRNA pseudouridine55 synthase|nr:tRNA pseudouridine(55) synthase TruB [Ignavibacteria bacterium]